MKWKLRNPGTTTAILAVVVLVVGPRRSGCRWAGSCSCRSPSSSLGATLVNGTYVLRRLLILIPTLFIVTAFTFWLQNSRGDTRDLAFIILGPGATTQAVDDVVQEFHLDEPMHTRYLLWLSDAVRGDLGRSAIQGQEVSTAITNAIPVTLQLMLYAQLARPAHRRAGRGLRGVPGEPPRRPHRQHGRAHRDCRSPTSCWRSCSSCSSPSAGSRSVP